MAGSRARLYLIHSTGVAGAPEAQNLIAQRDVGLLRRDAFMPPRDQLAAWLRAEVSAGRMAGPIRVAGIRTTPEGPASGVDCAAARSGP
jgi:hypothetical protein